MHVHVCSKTEDYRALWFRAQVVDHKLCAGRLALIAITFACGKLCELLRTISGLQLLFKLKAYILKLKHNCMISACCVVVCFIKSDQSLVWHFKILFSFVHNYRVVRGSNSARHPGVECLIKRK